MSFPRGAVGLLVSAIVVFSHQFLNTLFTVNEDNDTDQTTVLRSYCLIEAWWSSHENLG